MSKILTTQWSESLYAPRSRPSYRMSAYQYLLARKLHDEMIKVLALAKGEVKIESGLLLNKDRELMNMESKIVSTTDDAMFGQPVRLDKQAQIEIYGEFFSMSVGAARISCEDPAGLFEAVTKAARARRIRLSRVGLVSGGGYRDSKVLCLANDKSVALAPDIVQRYFPIVPFVWRSENGGATIRRV